jgi:hypothetical protein
LKPLPPAHLLSLPHLLLLPPTHKNHARSRWRRLLVKPCVSSHSHSPYHPLIHLFTDHPRPKTPLPPPLHTLPNPSLVPSRSLATQPQTIQNPPPPTHRFLYPRGSVRQCVCGVFGAGQVHGLQDIPMIKVDPDRFVLHSSLLGHVSFITCNTESAHLYNALDREFWSAY